MGILHHAFTMMQKGPKWMKSQKSYEVQLNCVRDGSGLIHAMGFIFIIFGDEMVLRLLLTQRFLKFRCIRCVKIKDTDNVLPVKDYPQLP